LYYNVYRWYQPGTGRYTRRDPGLEGAGPINTPNIYTLRGFEYPYAADQPLRWVDPLGLTLKDALCTFKWALVGGAGGALGGCVAGAAALTLVEPGGGTPIGCGVGWIAAGGAGGVTGGQKPRECGGQKARPWQRLRLAA